MTPGSPFSNVVGHDQDSSTFTDVESTQTSDTTDPDAARPVDRDNESSLGVEITPQGTKEAGQDETAGDESTGQ